MKILCVNHDDKNPSMHLYPDGAYCYVCGYSCSLEEIGYDSKDFKTQTQTENIQEKTDYIKTLPKELHRGLTFHSGPEGYYILWPNNEYYKCRTHSGRPRYLAPRGVRQPLLWVRQKRSFETLSVIEGEINALSFERVFPECDWDVCSPGPASEMQRHVEEYSRYNRVVVFVDNDPAGIANGYLLKQTLLPLVKEVLLIPLDKDFNDQLLEVK